MIGSLKLSGTEYVPGIADNGIYWIDPATVRALT